MPHDSRRAHPGAPTLTTGTLPTILLRAVAVLLTVGAAAPASGQPHDEPPARNAVAVSVGVGRHSPVGTHLGVTPDRNHVLLAVQYERRLIAVPHLAVLYTPELVPALWLSNNPTYVVMGSAGTPQIVAVTGRSSVYGFGAAPIGFEAHARVARRVELYGGSAVGTIWFARAVPDPFARAFNFTFDLRAGMLWQLRGANALRVGYMFHHLSNANTAPSNPGVDGAIGVLGLQHAFGTGRPGS
jgi:hypothetical protein